MERILFVNGCAREGSRTEALGRYVLGKLDGQVEEVRLFDGGVPPLCWDDVLLREACVREGRLDAPVLRYAAQFAGADTVVAAAPYWDLLFPAVVRAYFEAVTVTGVTFRYTPEGRPEGLCRAKRLIYVTTSGGPIGDNDFGFRYIRTLAQTFYGIPQTLCFTAEGLDIVGADVEGILRQARERVDAALAGA